MSESESTNDDVVVDNVQTGEVTSRHSTPEEEKARLEATAAQEQHEREEKEREEKRKQIIRDAHYESRVVIFLDILGWGEIVDQSTDIPESFLRIINVAYNFKAIAEGLNSDGDDPFDTRITHFSDSLVISLPEADSRPERLEFFLLGLISATAHSGLFVRGGITIGEIYHKEGMVFGPALNRAYELESKHAKYPRILLDENIYKGWTEVQLSTSWRKYRDNHYFYDFVRRLQELPCNKKHLSPIKSSIESALVKYRNNRKILVKYCWLAKYFNESTSDDVFIAT